MNKQRLPLTLLLLAAMLLIGGCRQADTARTVSERRPDVPLELIKITTEDKFVLAGRVFGEGEIGVVLAHTYGVDQNSWGDLPKFLSARGFTVLTFDFRGHGWSQGPKDVSRSAADVEAAVRLLRKRVAKVVVIGAGTGSTAALKAAQATDIDGIAALSAPDDFGGLAARNGVDRLSGPKLFMAAAGDDGAADAARALYLLASEPKEIEIVAGGDHGTKLLRRQKEVERLLDWLERAVDDEG
jgi:pimeloyl-ACP methyl ester carboxylesterase